MISAKAIDTTQNFQIPPNRAQQTINTEINPPKAMIKNFEPRLYQQTIFHTCSEKNTLVVLPTGMGKTNIFLMLAAHRLNQYPDSKILFIGPTKPLIDQYINVFKSNFEIDESYLAIFTGNVSPEKRQELWKTSKIIFSTPQGLENDII